MRTTLRPAFLSMLIFSTELVFGPVSTSQLIQFLAQGGHASIPIVQMMDVRR